MVDHMILEKKIKFYEKSGRNTDLNNTIGLFWLNAVSASWRMLPVRWWLPALLLLLYEQFSEEK